MADPQKLEKRFGVMRGAKRIWAVSSVHGETDKLKALHDLLGPKLKPGDRLIYLGNVIGRGPDVRGTLDELLHFRREMMALEPAEEFATDPRQVLEWMLSQGVDATLEAYGSSKADALMEGRRGAMELTRWTNALRNIGMNEASYLYTLREQNLRRQLLVTVGEVAQSPKALMDALNQFNEERRILKYVLVPKSAADGSGRT